MEVTRSEPVAVVAVGAILPDAPDAATFWENVKSGRYSISEVAPSRWDPELYFDPDPSAPDKTYSKIGGWVRDWGWEPMAWKLPIPPKVGEAMDDAQKWAVACTRAVLEDYGAGRELDRERTAVILGNAMAGELHYLTSFRIFFPEYAEILAKAPTFAGLPSDVQRAVLEEFHREAGIRLPPITEDTMPGELGNVLAGRVANLFNFRGPNFVTDAACGSAMAAVSAAVRGLGAGEFDAVITGGVDRNMGVSAYVKFCKIGALSATGTRPYAEGADGFVMGEGAGLFLLKRLADAERDGDRILAVIRSMAGSSDGKGRGITAPNPIGQRLCVERAWAAAGEAPNTATLVEGHGTSTRVGDVVEVTSLAEAFGDPSLRPGSIALGSVKSNIGHLKAAAGAAGLLKTVMALSEGVLPPSINFHEPNPDIDFSRSPFAVNTELREWERPAGGVRRAGVSAFGFGGTNWHAVLEEYVPGRFDTGNRIIATPEVRTVTESGSPSEAATSSTPSGKAPLRGAAVIGAATVGELAARLEEVGRRAGDGHAPRPEAPLRADLAAPERLAIDFADAADLAGKAQLAAKALGANDPAMWRALRARGIFRGSGPAPKVAFLYPGQGSQYANMARILAESEPIVAETFAEADEVMEPLLGRTLTSFLFVDPEDPAAMAAAEMDLMQTAITQPAVLAVDLALTRLLASYGFEPDMVMGHSLGEYGALVAAGSLTFANALEAVSARGREMASITVEDNGKMAAVFAPIAEVERIVEATEGYIVIANINSSQQAVIGGASDAVDRAVAAVTEAGGQAIPLPVSHAFHTSIVAPASVPLRAALVRLDLRPPRLPIVANVTGGFYPSNGDVTEQMLDILARQVASPVQFVKGLGTLYEAGARLFVEVGPKRALQGFVDDVLGARDGVASLFTNHPKVGEIASFNQALCGLYAAGRGAGRDERPVEVAPMEQERTNIEPNREPGETDRPVVITGAALGLPGTERVFDDGNVGRILRGEQLIDAIPTRLRKAMLDKHITRLVKRENGDPSFETIDEEADVIRLAGRAGAFDLEEEFGVAAERMPALDRSTRLAIGAGIDALRDAGIPLVQHYKTTSLGTKLPDRWMLPEEVGDQTGVIYASAFPAYDSLIGEVNAYHRDRARRERLSELKTILSRVPESDPVLADELDRRIVDLEEEIEAEPYRFDRRFLFKALSMGHSQFAEIVGARGPNTQVNSACASTTQAIALGEDWIRTGRCRRVIVIAADDATSDNLMEWIGSGFLVSGAAATDDVVEDAATPFDRRRHGMIIGMGAAALILESAEAAAERGIRPICEVLGAVHANSAFHGSRLDVRHIAGVMEGLVSGAERRWGIHREEIAPEMVFVSHETYTPARGGSAAAEVEALRAVFDGDVDSVVVANTKGFTGHPMGVGIEDIVAVKALESGIVPPVPNYKEPDPDLGSLNLSKGGAYPIRYALRLAAGFGSQIAMSLLRWVPSPDGTRTHPSQMGFVGRIADQAAWNTWLSSAAGTAAPELEVVQRRLRIRDDVEALRHVEAPPAALVDAPLPVKEPEPAPVAITEPAPVTLIELEPEVEAAPEIAVPAAAAESLDEEAVREVVLDLVAETTGYPPDMLDPDLDLEADLGVDTVKQAEIFAAIRSRYDIPRDESLKLRDFPTLTHVVQFVLDRAPGGAPAPAPVAPEPAIVSSVPEVASEPEAVEPALAPSSAELSEEAVREVVLDLVAETTGYPPDMLDPDLDLEADLGVDTVKQAEIFAAIRSRYDIPRDESLKLRDFPTLSHVVQFVLDRAPRPDGDGPGGGIPVAPAIIDPVPAPTSTRPPGASNGQAAPPATAEPALAAPRTFDPALRFAGLEAADAIPRRVAVPVMRPSFEQTAPTGVQIGPGSRIVVMADAGGVAKELIWLLEERGAEVLLIDEQPDAASLAATVEEWAAAGPPSGAFWLPALDPEEAVGEMDLAGWKEALRVRVKLLYATARTLYDDLARPGAFLVAATRLGGFHGYDEAGAAAPMGGAVTGFTKALKRERETATVKAVDVETDASAAQVAEALVQEALRDPGCVEVGHANGLRWTVSLDERPAADGADGLALGPDSVIAVTGAAGSIVSAIVSDLAGATGASFHLLDLAPEPDPGDPDLARFGEDREGLKRDLVERARQAGERPTPIMIEKQLAGLERGHAALSAIRAVQAAGGTARYHQVDLTDADAVAAAVDAIRKQHGRIDALLHAAGLEISRFLPDKEPREFDLVFDVKSNGWFNLLHAIGDMPLGAAVVFSSVAGRFGNGGQTDYSSANDLLCKSVSSFRRTRPETRGIAIDWTAWAGIGMASRGSIPKMMEAAGIDMLPPEAGIPVIRRELVSGGFRGEIVVGSRLGILLQEWDERGGIEPAGLGAGAHGPVSGAIASMGVHDGLRAEVVLDPSTQPFLDHHRIDGTPVLPGVMGIETFAEVASAALPGWHVAAIENVRFQAPLKCYRDEPRTVTVEARFSPDGDDVVAACRLIGSRSIPGREEPQVTTHFTGTVRLSREAPAARTEEVPEPAGGSVAAEDVYRVYFHGPAYRVLERAWPGEVPVGLLSDTLPANHRPEAAPLLAAPRLIELCFQTAGMWELCTLGRFALPTEVGRVRLLADPAAATGRIRALVHPSEDGSRFDASVVDGAGTVILALEDYGTVELPGALAPAALEALRAAVR